MRDSAPSWLTDSPLGGGPPCLFMTGRLARGSGGLSRRDPRGGATGGCGTLLHIECQPIESIAHTVLAHSTCKLHTTDSPLGGGPPCVFMTGRLARGRLVSYTQP